MNSDKARHAGKPDQDESKRVAIYMPALADGGAERAMFRLAGALIARGWQVDFIVDREQGPNAALLPASANLIVLARGNKWTARARLFAVAPGDAVLFCKPVLSGAKPPSTLRQLISLADYLKSRRPTILLALLAYAPIYAVWAVRMAGISTPLIVSERNHFSSQFDLFANDPIRLRALRYHRDLMARAYPRAEARVAVSEGVAEDLARCTKIDPAKIEVVHNPVVSKELDKLAAEAPEHPWAVAPREMPLILAVGRLVTAKDFMTLLDAFALVRSRRQSRLIILGDGPERDRLEARIGELGLSECVALPGWMANPYALMARCDVFVSSSLREGLCNSMIEALYCGATIVATDCPSGTADILGGGRYGDLVPLRQVAALAEAIGTRLDYARNPASSRARANEFSVERGVARWLDLIERVARPEQTTI